MTEVKPEPCPFCGGKPKVYENGAGWCVQCEGGHWLSAAINDVKCCETQTIEYYPTKDEAIRVWNHRPGEQVAYRKGLERQIEIAREAYDLLPFETKRYAAIAIFTALESELAEHPEDVKRYVTPDLYEACKAALPELEFWDQMGPSDDDTHKAVLLIRAALAKADKGADDGKN
jgi:hypothetical protein